MLIAVTYLLPKGVNKEMIYNCKGYEVIKNHKGSDMCQFCFINPIPRWFLLNNFLLQK